MGKKEEAGLMILGVCQGLINALEERGWVEGVTASNQICYYRPTESGRIGMMKMLSEKPGDGGEAA